ncbi:MAG: hypothetical protein ACI90R_001816, partial [Alteromonas macleodii]
ERKCELEPPYFIRQFDIRLGMSPPSRVVLRWYFLLPRIEDADLRRKCR